MAYTCSDVALCLWHILVSVDIVFRSNMLPLSTWWKAGGWEWCYGKGCRQVTIFIATCNLTAFGRTRFDPEYGGNMLFRNVGIHLQGLHNVTSQHLEDSPVLKPQNLHHCESYGTQKYTVRANTVALYSYLCASNGQTEVSESFMEQLRIQIIFCWRLRFFGALRCVVW
jgi:hypothetical protein